MKYNKELVQKQLMEAAKQSYESREDLGKFGKYWAGIPFPQWKANDGDHVIDILAQPAGDLYPIKSCFRDGKLDPDSIIHFVDIWAHTGVGLNEDMIICNNKSYMEGCFLCEEEARMRRMLPPPEEDIDKVKAKRRCLYLIIVRDSEAEESKGIQYWEIPYFYSEDKISAQARKPRGGGFIPYSDFEEGQSVCFNKQGKGLDAYSGHKLDPRNYVIPKEIIEQIVPLSDYLVKKDYEYIKNLYLQGIAAGEGNSGQASSRKPKETSYTPPITRAPRPAPSEEASPKTSEPNPTRETRGAPKEEPTTEEPVRRARRPVPQEESEPEPKPEPKPSSTSNKCPAGGNFGVDIDKLTNCVNCEDWDACALEAEKIE